MEAAVLQNPNLGKMAAEAFQAFSRAYATFPKSLKPIFHPRALHLGHVARSFGLAKPPSTMKKQMSKKLTPTVNSSKGGTKSKVQSYAATGKHRGVYDVRSGGGSEGKMFTSE